MRRPGARPVPTIYRLLSILLLLLAAPVAAHADWIATGSFRYIDRPFDETGFLVFEPPLPIRLATVEVRDAALSGSNGILATGATDAQGRFSIAVPDSRTRTVYIRVLTTSSAVTGLHLRVQSIFLPADPYAVASPDYASHSPYADIDVGEISATIGSGGEPFNIYDVALLGIDFLASLTGSRPGAGEALTLDWDPSYPGNVSSYVRSDMRIRVGIPSAYNDTVISHEFGHYAFDLHSEHDSPGGAHYLSDCDQDLRLAYEEGRATWFGQSVRRYHGLSRPELYVRTSGGVGPGHLDFYFNVETASPFSCNGAASEVAVYSALWDLTDSPQTGDTSPGVDDDSTAVPATENWDVDSGFLPGAVDRTLEDFWDGWFTLGKGLLADLTSVFQMTGVEFYPDGGEPNDSAAGALPIAANEAVHHRTFFSDPEGDGSGAPDEDYFRFDAAAGTPYTVETFNLWGRADTSLEILAADGTTVIAANDDRIAGDSSSFIEHTAASTGPLFVRSYHAPGFGIYGSYDLRVTGGQIDLDQDGSPADEDCDDTDPSVYPGATERCNGIDDNCNGAVDEPLDLDGDGFVSCGDDCDDGDAAVHPGAVEICNGIDDNCDGAIDEGNDADGDGFTACDGDCDDADAAVHPAATEICNDLDDDCDGTIDGPDASGAMPWHPDADGDRFGDPGSTTFACAAP
jgi:hypothetical protein